MPGVWNICSLVKPQPQKQYNHHWMHLLYWCGLAAPLLPMARMMTTIYHTLPGKFGTLSEVIRSPCGSAVVPQWRRMTNASWVPAMAEPEHSPVYQSIRITDMAGECTRLSRRKRSRDEIRSEARKSLAMQHARFVLSHAWIHHSGVALGTVARCGYVCGIEHQAGQ